MSTVTVQVTVTGGGHFFEGLGFMVDFGGGGFLVGGGGGGAFLEGGGGGGFFEEGGGGGGFLEEAGGGGGFLEGGGADFLPLGAIASRG
jgi:hypothetical protein